MSKGKFDELLQGMGAAIADIREKVVEEPMWGRPLTEPHGIGHGQEPSHFQEMVKEMAPAEKPEARQQEQELDR